MLDRRRSTPFDRLGRWLLTLPVGQRLGIAGVSLVLFVALSSLALGGVIDSLAESESWAVGAQSAAKPKIGSVPYFMERLERVTDIAMRCFLECNLSKQNIITDFEEAQDLGRFSFDYRYWEIWVPEEFEFDHILKLFRQHIEKKAQNVTIDDQVFDAKTFRIAVSVDGLNTHRFLFTKAAQEAPEGAKVLLAHLPSGQQKIDVGGIPSVKYKGSPRLVIIIDDIGYRETIDHLFMKLPVKVTFSILPFSPTGKKMAEDAHKKGHEIMLHMPMEPISYPEQDPGKGRLLLSMEDSMILRQVQANLEQIPHIVGVNNHMGSAFTAHRAKMQVVLRPIKKRGLFFIDSVTIGHSVAYRTAQEAGVPSASRNLFLDHSPDYESICRQVDLAGRIAEAQGVAIAIGHPFQNTYRALRDRLPALLERRIKIVPASQLVR